MNGNTDLLFREANAKNHNMNQHLNHCTDHREREASPIIMTTDSTQNIVYAQVITASMHENSMLVRVYHIRKLFLKESE
jgi:hypothetical protein